MNRNGSTRDKACMMSAALVALALVGAPLSADIPAAPAAKEPAATQATTAPTTAPAPTLVKKGTLELEVKTDAFLQPLDAYELKLKMKAYSGPLTVVSAAAPGAMVKQGDALLELDPKNINWDLEQAANAAAAAKVALTKAEADLALGQKMDALALRQSEDGVKNAEASVKWFEQVDGPQMLLSAELQVRQIRNRVEDQDDELEQLRKMYKSEDLTSATADIVVKRAVRSLELMKISQKMTEERKEKTTTHEYPIARQRVLDALEQARYALAALETAQQQSAVQRKNAVSAARIGLEQAEQKLADLTADFALFSTKSPADGVVIYGNLVEGAWQGGDPKVLKAGEKLAAGAIALRVVTLGKLKVDVGLSESQATWVQAGMKATITPVAFPQLSYESTATAPLAKPRGPQNQFGYEITLPIESADPRVQPGMKANVRIEAPKEEAIVVPLSFVTNGKVTVKGKDGNPETRTCEFGRSDGTQIEVKSGLSVGEELIAPGKK